LILTPEGKRPVRRQTWREEDIQIELKKYELEKSDLIKVAGWALSNA
jgi:hypothetical protein